MTGTALERLQLERAPQVLAAAGGIAAGRRSSGSDASARLRYADRSLGALRGIDQRGAKRSGVFAGIGRRRDPSRSVKGDVCAADDRCRADFTADTHASRGAAAWMSAARRMAHRIAACLGLARVARRRAAATSRARWPAFRARNPGRRQRPSARARTLRSPMARSCSPMCRAPGPEPDAGVPRQWPRRPAGARLRPDRRLRAASRLRPPPYRRQRVHGWRAPGMRARFRGAARVDRGARDATRAVARQLGLRTAAPARVRPVLQYGHARSGNPDDFRPRDRGQSRGGRAISRRSGAPGRGARRAAGKLRVHGPG